MNNSLIPKYYFAKGDYFSLTGNCPFTRLIYPIPVSGGLGIHLTLDLAGSARFGPDIEWIEDINFVVDSNKSLDFYAAIKQFWPNLELARLVPGYSGIRPKIVGPGQEDADFMIQTYSHHEIDGLINLFGIESPGITASLALAENVASIIDV